MRVRHLPAQPRSSRTTCFVPPLARWPDRGTYQLFFCLKVAVTLKIGRLGRFRFPRGEYVYTGRAARALRARVLRHVGGGARKHWHIDYLLCNPFAQIERVLLVSDDPEQECRASSAISVTRICVAPGFGASDCRAGCATHLWHKGVDNCDESTRS